jgi:hypothetical protein
LIHTRRGVAIETGHRVPRYVVRVSAVLLALLTIGFGYFPSYGAAQDVSFTSTADFDAGTKDVPGDGNYGVETATDNPAIVPGQIELASVAGDSFTLDDPNADTFKWDLGNACTVRGPQTIVRSIEGGALRLGAQKATGASRVGVVQASSISGDVDVRATVHEVETDPGADFELILTNEKRCYPAQTPKTADGAFYEWDEGPTDASFTLRAWTVRDGRETACGGGTTLSIDPVHLRISRSGSTWTWSYSSDGVVWTVDEVCVHAVTGSLWASLMAKDSKAGITSTWEADDFHVAAGTVDPGGFRTSGNWISPAFDIPAGATISRIEIGGIVDATNVLDRSEIRRGGTVVEGFDIDNTLVLLPSSRICGSGVDVRVYLSGSGAGTPAVTEIHVFYESSPTTAESIALGTSTGTSNQCASDGLYDTKSESLDPSYAEHGVGSEILSTGAFVSGDGPPAPSDTDASDDVSVRYSEENVPAFTDVPPGTGTVVTGDLDGGAIPQCLASDDGTTCTVSEGATASTFEHTPGSELLSVGTEDGSFPTGIAASDDEDIEYTEADGPGLAQDYAPTGQAILNGVEGTPPVYQQGSFVRRTDGPGPQSVTGIRFQPRAAIFWWTRQSFPGTQPNNYAGMGFVASATEQYAIAWGDDDAVSPSNAGRRLTDRAISILGSGTPTVDGEASFVGFTPEGFDLDWIVNPLGAHATVINFIVLGETVTDAGVDLLVGPAAGFTGNRAYGGVGFQPDAILMMSNLLPGLGDAPHAVMGFGAASGPLNRAAVSMEIPDDKTIHDNEVVADLKALLVYDPALAEPTTDQVIDFVSFNPDGVTLEHELTRTGNVVYVMMSLKGGQYKVDYLFRPTVLGDQHVGTVGFHPSGVLFYGMAGSVNFGSQDTGAEFVMAAGSENQGVVSENLIWSGSNDHRDVVLSDANMHLSATRTILDLSLSSRGVQNEADYKSSDPDGFTITWTRIQSSSTQKWLYLAFGGGSDGGSSGTCTGPTEIDSTANLGDNLNDNTRTVFRNPRGTQARYAIYRDSSNNDLVYQFSGDGCGWSGRHVISTNPPNFFDLAVHDTGTELRLFLVVVEGDVVKYRRGTIADGFDAITWDAEATVVTATRTLAPSLTATIVRTSAGRLVIAYASDVSFGSATYRRAHLVGSNDDDAAPVWGAPIVWYDPSASTNNNGKSKTHFTLAAYSSAFPNRFVMDALVPDSVDTTHYQHLTDTPEWDGTAFTPPSPTLGLARVDPADSLSCVVDTTDRAHCLIEEASDLFSVHANTPGLDDWTLKLAVPPEDESGRSTLSIDKSVTPNVLYAIYDKSLVDLDLYYKTTPIDNIVWSGENVIPYAEDTRDIGSAIQDYAGGIHVIGDRWTNVLWYHEIRLGPPPPPPPPGSNFPLCVQESDDFSCQYSESDVGGSFRVEVQYSWAAIDTSGVSWELIVEGREGASDPEAIEVYFFEADDATRTPATCSITLLKDTVYNCGSLTPSQLDSGSPDIVFVDSSQVGDLGASSFLLDQVLIRRTFTGKSLEVRYEWSAIPTDGSSYELQVEGHVTDEPIDVQVLTPPSAWTTRLTLASTVDSILTYVPTAEELGGGTVFVRFVDTDPSEPSASTLSLDRVAIVRTVTVYNLELVLEWAGVTPSDVNLLDVQAAREGDSEDLLVEVWDHQDGDWQAVATISSDIETLHSRALAVACTLSADDCEISPTGDVRVRVRDLGGADSTETTFLVDLVVVRLSDSANALDLVYAWSLGARSGESTVIVEGYRSDTEDFIVQVWNGVSSTWDDIGTIASAADATLTHLLTDDQISATFEVRVRFVGADEGSTDDIPSELVLDYVVIRTREFRLEIVDLVSGVSGDGPFLLRLEGSLAAAGENFDVYVWDFGTSSYSLWLSAAFTTADQTFERALAATEISGGVVQVRIVDTVGVGDGDASVLRVDLLEVVDQP